MIPKRRIALHILNAVCLLRIIPAIADPVSPSWVLPDGWHIDRAVRHAVVSGNLTGTGARTRAVLLTNGQNIRLTVFVDYRAHEYRAYDVFTEPVENLKSDEGIKVVGPSRFELEPGSADCASKWTHCTPDGRVYFQPPMPVLWITMGEWGGSVFKWIDYSKGFERFSVGD